MVLIIGSNDAALALMKDLYQHGLSVLVIWPSAVSKDAERLRITLPSAHTKKNMQQLISALAAMTHNGTIDPVN